MSSAGSAAAKVAQQTYRSQKTARERWIIKEVLATSSRTFKLQGLQRCRNGVGSLCMQAYPLYATIGLGCVGAVLYLGRLALGPDTM